MEKTLKKLWDMCNFAETIADCKRAEEAVRSANVSNDEFDDLMMTLTYNYREAYRSER